MGIVDELQKLEQLRGNGALTDDEFARAKALLLANPPAATKVEVSSALEDQLADLQYQNELARIDREWEIERRQFQMVGRYGRVFTPTIGMGVVSALVGGIFGTFWLVLVMTITRAANNAIPDGIVSSLLGIIFPLMGLLFIFASVGWGLYCCTQAARHNEAYRKYRERRLRVTSGKS